MTNNEVFMTALTVGEGTQVTLNFSLKLENGDVVDSNFDGAPVSFVVGDGNLLPGFERALFGLSEGSRETLTIEPENGFGQANPNNLQVIPRDQFDPTIALEKGLVLSFADAQKAKLPGVVADFDEERVTIDFNHPLAGRRIIFDVHIHQVSPATTH